MPYYTKVSLAGAKASVIQMLNAAIKNVGNGETIMPEDSVESIKSKFILTDEEGYKSWLRMLFHDFLDMECIADPVMKQRRDAFHEEFGNDSSYEYAVVVKDIIDKSDDYELELSLGEDELGGIMDWAGWADLTEVYGVTIFADFYDYETFFGTTVYELVDGDVKTNEINPSLDTEGFEGFYEDFSTLIDMYPGRYKAVMVEALENKIEQLQDSVRRYKLSIIMDNLKQNGGHAEIPEGWTELEDFAFKGCKELKSITLPSSLKAIGTSAFEGCENLREITIPTSVESIGYCAFKDCPCSEGMDESYWKERPVSEIEDEWIKEILG